MPVILAHEKWRKQDQELKVVLNYIASLKQPTNMKHSNQEQTNKKQQQQNKTIRHEL